MIRLLKIEFKKLLSYKAFWVMLILYTVLQAIMIFGIPGLIDWVGEKSGDVSRFRIFKAIVFNFPDIWQNIAYVASSRYFIKIILGIIAIIIITNEYHFLTICFIIFLNDCPCTFRFLSWVYELGLSFDY